VSDLETSPVNQTKKTPSKFRQDILGLRGIAVLLVILNHFGMPGLRSGFIGVDIFFVISGYLIVGLMYQEFAKNGKSLGGYGWISITSFYERRVRRILPAAFLVLACIYIASLFIDDSNARIQITRDIMWAFLFVSNINFAQQQTDYFTKDSLPSPALHYWSLAVEEQFYLLMPFIFMAVANWHGFSIAGRRYAARRRLYIFISFISAVSLLSMIFLFPRNSLQIYFSLFSRMWEFGIGALAAITLPVLTVRLKVFIYVLRWIGYVMLLIGIILITPNNYGYLLALPTFGIAIIVYVNNQIRAGFAYSSILTNPLFCFFGKISFSLYLFHWPFLALAPYFGLQLNWWNKIAILGVVILIATLAERYVERPFLRVGFISEFHVSPFMKSRRVTGGILIATTTFLVIATYQPIISGQLSHIQVRKQQPFWSPPASSILEPRPKPSDPATLANPSPNKKAEPIYMGIFGDSTNQCCSSTGAFWPRLVAQKMGWRFNDYSRPATTYFIDGVGSNGCKKASDCPSVVGQLKEATGKKLDVITLAAGIGDCPLAKSQPENFQNSLTELFQNFRRTFPDAYIVAMGLVALNTEERSACISAVNQAVSQASRTAGIKYLGGESNWITSPKKQLTAEGSHLNDLGHQVFARNFVSWIKGQSDFKKT
jgi:peptidoglycan/LPS O-acetylase OafA/YrhL